MKKQIIEFDDNLVVKIDAWRGKKSPIPPFKTAVVELLQERFAE